jgi:hypothetical protein
VSRMSFRTTLQRRSGTRGYFVPVLATGRRLGRDDN